MTTTTADSNPAHKKSDNPAIQRNLLAAKDFYRLCEWSKAADLQGCYTFVEVAKRAAAGLGMKVTEANVKTAFDTVGLLLPQDPSKPTRAAKGTTTNERALARALVSLMQELGKDPGNDLLKIAA